MNKGMGSEPEVLLMNEENMLGDSGLATPEENGHEYELETPKETLFDSFAPPTDKLLLVRRLKFTRALVKDFSNALEWEDEEERLFKIMYSTIMDAILEEAAVAVHTCPAPPIKAARKPRWIDKEICRKLEF